MSDMISRNAANGALEERRDKYLKDSQTWLQIQLDILAIRALPAAPAEDVRAGALKEAAAYHESMAADEDALSAKYRGGSNPWFAHVQAAKWHREHAAAILALIPEAKP